MNENITAEDLGADTYAKAVELWPMPEGAAGDMAESIIMARLIFSAGAAHAYELLTAPPTPLGPTEDEIEAELKRFREALGIVPEAGEEGR